MKRTAFTFLVLLAALTNAPVFGLSFDEVLRTIEDNYEMQSARLEVQILEAEARAAVSPEDLRFDLDPSLKITSETDGEFAGETSLSGSTSIFIPLGLSRMEQDNLNTIRNSITAARLKASETYTSTYILLFSLYQDLWLLQQEAAVLEAEVKSSELYMELMQERFNAGSLPLSSLSLVEETMIERQEALIRNGLAQRLAWFELSLNTGLDGDMPELEALDFEIEEIPRPPELETWIVENHPLIEQSRIGVEQIRLNLARLLRPDYEFSIRPFLNYQEHSFSFNYNLVDPEITAGYDFPINTWGEIPTGSGSSTETWNTGISFNFSLGTNRNDRLGAVALNISLEKEEARLDYIIQSTLLKVRSSYQQLLRSRELLENAERNLERSVNNRKVVEAKRDLDQAPRHEVLEAEANEARARWKILEARIDSNIAYLNLLKEAALFEETM